MANVDDYIMSGENRGGHSKVEIALGESSIMIEGSEQFIQDELPGIMGWVRESAEEMDLGSATQCVGGDGEAEPEGKQATLEESGPTRDEEKEEESEEESGALAEVADSIGVDAGDLQEHFYVDNGEVHIQNPMATEPKYALLGYCTIRSELTGETYHPNKETKEHLIDNEKVNIENWGGTLLYGLRRSGLIKDDPQTDKGRNRPFKITPKGHREFVNWVTNGD